MRQLQVVQPSASSLEHEAAASYRICVRCIMDTTDPDIVFDDNGICDQCRRAYDIVTKRLPMYKNGAYQLDKMARVIKEAGKNKPYDCIVGVSGGVDSTFAAYTAKQAGLRPLAVHFDNGWNAELAVKNIENTLKKMGIELYTHVVDWEEFRDLQLSFLRASVPDAEIPTDHGIWALLYQTAARMGIKYVITGTNINTESILPRSWTYYVTDWKYIKDIHRIYGTRPLKSFPHSSLSRFVYHVLFLQIKTFSILNAVEYDKVAALALLKREIGYREYGGKHHESIYTRFFQSYILPKKFNIDKRRAHLSSLIVCGQMTREEALAELKKPIADPQLVAEDLKYVVKKFGIAEEDFMRIMAAPVKSFRDYKNDSARYETLKSWMRRAQRWKLLPGQVGM